MYTEGLNVLYKKFWSNENCRYFVGDYCKGLKMSLNVHLKFGQILVYRKVACLKDDEKIRHSTIGRIPVRNGRQDFTQPHESKSFIFSTHENSVPDKLIPR